MVALCFDQQVIRDHHRHRSGFAGAGETEGLAHGQADVAGAADFNHRLGHVAQQRRLGQPVDLERAVLVAVGHVADDAHQRHAVEQGFAKARQRIGYARPGTTQITPGLPVLRA